MHQIMFTLPFTKDDWDSGSGAWRCPVLRVPGAEIEDLFVGSERVDRSRYEVLKNYAVIRWVLPGIPERVVASVKLKESTTERWKKIAVVPAVIATITSSAVTGTVTYYTKRSPNEPGSGAQMSKDKAR